MKTICKNIYLFSELPEASKVKALEKWEPEYFWMDEGLESIKKGIEALGGTVRDWSIDPAHASQSLVKWTDGNDYTDEDNMTGQRLRTWLLNNYYSVFYERKPLGGYPYKRRSKIQYAQTDCPFTGVCFDEDFLKPFRTFLKKPDRYTFEDLVNEGIENCLQAIQSDYEYQNSREALEEHFEANEYHFDEEGNLQ